MKNFVKKLLPVSLSRFALLSKDVEDIKTNMLCASEARSIHDELHWDVSVQLLNEVKALRDDLKSHDEKATLFAWEEYRKEGEALIDAKKRFFTSLPAATGSLRLLQLGSAKLLADFDSLCRDNDIPYFATCGTLLGAARHSGFIPWDDDIDLGMLREDIERLIGLVQSHDRFRVSVAFDGFVQCRQVRFQYADESIPYSWTFLFLTGRQPTMLRSTTNNFKFVRQWSSACAMTLVFRLGSISRAFLPLIPI